MFCESQTAVVSNCVLSGNRTFGEGSGGGAYGGTLNNCIITDNRAYEISVSGAAGGGAYQCILNNCTLSGNSASGGGGGAAFCILNNCTLTGNSAYDGGGGALNSTLNNCTLSGNSAYYDGGGAYGCTLNNCTVVGNSGDAGGGAYGCTLNNCIVSFNTATNGANYDAYSTLNYSCTSPQPTHGVGNTSADPLFVDTNGWANLHLQFNSPCINVGNNASAVGATDLDGNPRINRGTVDIGAYEFQSTTRYVDVTSTNATPPYSSWATAATNIQAAADTAVAGDEIVVTNGTYYPVAVGMPLALRSVNGPLFTVINGSGAVRCVDLPRGSRLSGFTLTNGAAYGVGGGVRCESTSVVVSDCVITGNQVHAQNNGDFGGGGAYSGTLSNCIVSLNSATVTGGGNFSHVYARGGGAYNSTVRNCTLNSNSVSVTSGGDYAEAVAEGGAASGCILNNCTMSGNMVFAWGDGGNFVDFNLYAEGGGTCNCTLRDCSLSGNSARIPSSLFVSAYAIGGGAHSCGLNTCTLTGNSVVAEDFSGGYRAYAGDGGASSCTMNNCIAYFNTSFDNFGPSHEDDAYDDSLLNYCCTRLLPTFGVGNITNAPLFVDMNGWTDLRLQSNSPCINAGNNASVTNATDLDGNLRISGGTVDIGAFEFQSPASTISYAWLQQYGLSINSSSDTADPDSDGVDNYHEWLAGTIPTNSFSSPAQLTITPSGTSAIVTWSTNAVGFTLQSATNLLSPLAWVTNSPAPVVVNGQNTVANPFTGPQQFYRLVQ